MIFIIMPAYNAQRHIKYAIKSVQKQTYREWKLIIVDDGSTDKTYNICSKFSDNDSRIHIIKQNNKGQLQARINAIEYCKKIASHDDFVTFLDSDDSFYNKNSLMTLHSSAKKDIDIVCSNFIRVFNNKLPIKLNLSSSNSNNISAEFNHQEIMEKLYISFFGVTKIGYELWSKMYRISLFDNPIYLENSPKKFAEDLVTNILVFPRAKNIAVIQNNTYSYSIGGSTSKFIPEFLDNYILVYNIRKEVIKKYYLPDEFNYYSCCQLRNVLWTWLLMCKNQGKYDDNQMIKEIKRVCDIPQIYEILQNKNVFNSKKQPKHFTMFILDKNYAGILDLIKNEKSQYTLISKIKRRIIK